MAGIDFQFEYSGLEELLKSPAVGAIAKRLADRMAEQIGDDADVNEFVTDRAGASVGVPAHLQTRDGALTRAAAAVGLQVHSPR